MDPISDQTHYFPIQSPEIQDLEVGDEKVQGMSQAIFGEFEQRHQGRLKLNNITLDPVKILSGQESFWTSHAPIPSGQQVPKLPLSSQEMQDLKKIIKQLPISFSWQTDITLMDMLGMTIHSALSSVIQAAKTDRENSLSTLLQITRKQFCRFWAFGTLSLMMDFDTRGSKYTKADFIAELERIFNIIKSKSELQNQSKYKTYYEKVLHSLILLQALSCAKEGNTFLNEKPCQHFEELTPFLPKASQKTENHYGGIQVFIGFMIDVCQATENHQMLANFRSLRDAYNSLPHAPSSCTSLQCFLPEVLGNQQQFLIQFFNVLKFEKQQDEEIKVLRNKQQEKFSISRAEELKKKILAAEETILFRMLMSNTIFLLEEYLHCRMPHHISLDGVMTQNRLWNQYLYQSALGREQQASYHLKRVSRCMSEMHFLTEAQKEELHVLSSGFAHDLDRLFAIDPILLASLKEISSAPLSERLGVLNHYASLLPLLTAFFQQFYQALQDLNKTHSQRCIEWLGTLSSVICSQNQDAIRKYFETVLIICMHRFSIMAFVYQNLKRLLPELNSTLDPLEDAIIPYLVMRDFEASLFQQNNPVLELEPFAEPLKISTGERKDAGKLPLEIPASEKPLLPMPVLPEEQEEVSVALESKQEKRSKNKKKKVHIAKKETSSSASSTLNRPPRAVAPPLIQTLADPFSIYISEKTDSIRSKLRALGFEWDHSKGGHDYYALDGFKVTLSGHSKELKPKTAKSLEKRVNTFLQNRSQGP